ncbi:hypothetical protein RHGRI_001366 [Rhododendron griersonianum]|uniref:3-hydroxyisobutyryl-CoA hydrolase n=1 Tax=Rhododendron griersonianum TaxID=479676 RepID=A0AAV6LJY0_9ERIC|nr:hypothetical protein RHGRI_001366 [Rhododendron griersonianum]
MQSLKSASLIRRSLRISPFKSSYRSLTSLSTNALSNDSDDIVLVEGKACSRTAILNRPPVLNALNTAVGARLQKLYKSWEDNPDIGFVMLKGSGRAFCAGGDIVSLYHLINEGNIEACKDFCRTVYGFIYQLGTYLKPHVALLNGITMGGGGGVSIPGTFRVATNKTVFATPETLIGFHPDAGASFYLSHLPGYLGEYLALTGGKLNGVEMIGCGLATHYSLSARLPLLEEQLGKLVTDDPSVIETSLGTYSDVVYPDSTSVLHRIETLDKCFSHDTVEEIIDSLESEAAKSHDDWCASTLKKLKYASPLSLKVSLRSIREGRYQTFDQCLVREYRMSLQGMSKQISNDFCEGVRARMVDKDLAPKFQISVSKPQWNPPILEQVSTDMVDQYFSPLSECEPDLELPTKQREAFT